MTYTHPLPVLHSVPLLETRRALLAALHPVLALGVLAHDTARNGGGVDVVVESEARSIGLVLADAPMESGALGGDPYARALGGARRRVHALDAVYRINVPGGRHIDDGLMLLCDYERALFSALGRRQLEGRCSLDVLVTPVGVAATEVLLSGSPRPQPIALHDEFDALTYGPAPLRVLRIERYLRPTAGGDGAGAASECRGLPIPKQVS